MQQLINTQKIIIDEFEKLDFYKRDLFGSFSFSNQITGIIGPRGIGKTTFLVDMAKKLGAREGKVLYVIADNSYFLENKLIDLVDYLYNSTDVNVLLIDEIHKYSNWIQELKNISDVYKSFKIIFTGSSSIDLIKGKYDLSRRATVYNLNGLSFREYLEFYYDISVPKISLSELLKGHVAIANDIKVDKPLKLFEEYVEKGYYPFLKNLDTDLQKFQALENSVEKSIYEDVPSIHPKIKTSSLIAIEKLFKFILNSYPGELSAYKLANSLKKSYESVVEYMKILEELGFINALFAKNSGHAYISNPEKLYPENSNLLNMYSLPTSQEIVAGKVRETFFVNQIKNAKYPIFYSKNGDFDVDNNVFEIGGKSKNKSQIKGISESHLVLDNVLIGYENVIPLYLFGLLY